MQPWIVQGFERRPYDKSWACKAPPSSKVQDQTFRPLSMPASGGSSEAKSPQPTPKYSAVPTGIIPCPKEGGASQRWPYEAIAPSQSPAPVTCASRPVSHNNSR